MGENMAKQYKIKISPDGQITAESIGFKGKECLKHLETLEDLLGAKIIDSEFLDDYFVTEDLETEETTTEEETENVYLNNG